MDDQHFDVFVKKKKKFMKQFLLYNCTVFDWDIDGRNQTCSNEQIGVWFSVEISFFWTFLGFMDYQASVPKTEIIFFQWNHFWKMWKSRLRPWGETSILFWRRQICLKIEKWHEISLQFLEFPFSHLFDASVTTKNSSSKTFVTIPKSPLGVSVKKGHV